MVRGLVALAVLLSPHDAVAQTPVLSSSFEIGVIVSTLRFATIDPMREFNAQEAVRRYGPLPRREEPRFWMEPGFGVRVAYRLTHHVALEGSLSLFLKFAGEPFVSRSLIPDDPYRGRDKVEAIGGARLDHRYKKIGVFLKGGAGVMRFGRFPTIDVLTRVGNRITQAIEIEGGPQAFPVFDVGGGVVVFASPRYSLRGDAGDAIVRYHPQKLDLNPTYVRHNLQIVASVMINWR